MFSPSFKLFFIVKVFLIIQFFGTGTAILDVQKHEISFPCDSDNECLQDFKNSTCQNGNCVCDGEMQDCLLSPQFTVGDNCTQELDCSILDAFCKDEKCECKEGFIATYSKQKCLPIAQTLNETCQIDIQCNVNIPSSVCFKNICMCQLFYHEVHGSCFKKSALNKVCSTPENCWHIDNSNCTNDQCVCNEGFVQSYDNKSCLKISISQTDYCELDEQCTDYFGPSAYCAESKCKCKDRFHLDPKSLRCIKNIEYGGKCEKHEDCYQAYGDGQKSMECALGQCTCRRPYRLDGTECIKNAGTSHSAPVIILIALQLLYMFL